MSSTHDIESQQLARKGRTPMMKSSSWLHTRVRPVAALAALVMVGTLVSPLASSSATAATVPPAVQHGPSGIPDRIVLTPSGDLATSQSVTWRTGTGVSTAQGQIRVATSEPYRTDYTTVAAAESKTVATALGYSELFHTVRFTSLQPATTYMYRVGDGTNFSEWQHFTTAAASAEDFSFIYLGDVQNGIQSDASRVIRNAFRDRPDARIVLQAGDLIDEANNDAQWGEVFEAAGYTFGTQNFLAAAGNHEYEGEQLSDQWEAQFDYPANGPTGSPQVEALLDGTAYYTDYQGVRFISLNSNITESDALAVQTQWLDGVLGSNPNKWTVVFFHHPVFSLDEGRNNRAIREAWVPLFEQYNVDLVLQGHDHNYGRGNTNAAEENLPEHWNEQLSYNGPVYAISVVGSKMYSGAGPRLWLENDAHLKRLGGGIQLYQLIDVSGDTLRYEARTADGEYYDGLTIVKNESGKAVTDDAPPQEIDPGSPLPCLGCEEPTDPEEPEVPGEHGPVDYEVIAGLDSVVKPNAALPAGSAFSQVKERLYLGDQNGRKIFEIDPETDEITREMTLPENIRDLGIDDEGELLYVGQQNRNWVVVSIADATFGQVVRGPFSFIESNRSIDVDPERGLVFGAIPSRGVEVLDAVTGASLGVINGTGDAYYVTADPANGLVTTVYFSDVADAINIEAFDIENGYAQLWEKTSRANPRQLDADSTNGLLYVGYTGTGEGSGGFSVHDSLTGELLGDFADPKFGKDGYGISVDEENQRVFVSNRDFRLNPPGSELEPVAVTVSQRIGAGSPIGGGDPTDPEEPVDPEEPTDPPGGLEYTPTPMESIPSSEADPELDTKPVGSVVDPATGHLFVGNEQRPARVIEIDPETDTVVATHVIPGGTEEGVRDVAIDSEKGELYVAYGNSWMVLDLTDDSLIRGPFAFTANVRGLDVDLEGGRVFGATRGTGFQVMDATTGATIQVVTDTDSTWRSHGIAFDPSTNRLYLSNENPTGVDGVRVYDGTSFELLQSLPVAAPDLRSVAVDPVAQRLYLGHASDAFEASGVLVLSATDLSTIAEYPGTAFGNKVYGVSVDPALGRVYVSARDRFPTALIVLQRAE